MNHLAPSAFPTSLDPRDEPRRETILVVDDDTATRAYLAALLMRWGYDVRTAAGGREALNRLADGGVDLCLVDWLMPDLDGLDVVRRVRASEGGIGAGRVHMIMVTGRGGTAHVVDGLSAGADDYVSKPVEAAELRHRVQAGLRLVRANRALHQRNRALEETNAALDAAGWRMRPGFGRRAVDHRGLVAAAGRDRRRGSVQPALASVQPYWGRSHWPAGAV